MQDVVFLKCGVGTGWLFLHGSFELQHFVAEDGGGGEVEIGSGAFHGFAEEFDALVSDDVLDQLGNVMQTVRREDRQRSNSAGQGGKSGSAPSGKPVKK